MKKQFKIFNLLSVFTLAFGLSYAQLPDGSTAPDFTVTDINGETYRLYDLLDSGYTVVIDLNATWCGPCWSYHEAGHLEELWEDHGPAGATGVNANTTDDVFVMMIESDANTGMADLQGNTASSYGDWITGTNFPIVDDASVANAYNLTYYPTVFTICPNRILTESSALTAANHYTLVSECVSAVEGVNASVFDVESTIAPNGCGDEASGNVTVTVQNSGTQTLGTIAVALVADGDTLGTQNINASQLNAFETQDVTFNNISVSAESYTVVIVTADDNLVDNVSVEPVTLFDGNTDMFVDVVFLTDNYAADSYLEIADESGNVIWSQGNESVEGNYNTGDANNGPADPTEPLENNTEYTWRVNLPSIGCHTFFIGDYYGDGINSSQYGSSGTDGSWSIKNHTGAVISQIQELNFGGTDNSAFNNNAPGDTTNITNYYLTSLSLHPNPLNSIGQLRFELNSPSKVNLEIVDVLGKSVVSIDKQLSSGFQNLEFDVAHVPNGVYFAKLSINDEINVVKFTKLN